MVALLIRRGANPNVAPFGDPILLDGLRQIVLPQSEFEMMKILIDGGANVNQADAADGMTPLMCAASRGQTKSVQMLLDAGADVKLKSKAGKTALELAWEHGQTAIVKLLIAAAEKR